MASAGRMPLFTRMIPPLPLFAKVAAAAPAEALGAAVELDEDEPCFGIDGCKIAEGYDVVVTNLQ